MKANHLYLAICVSMLLIRIVIGDTETVPAAACVDGAESCGDAHREFVEAEKKVKYWEDMHAMIDNAQEFDETMMSINGMDDPLDKERKLIEFRKRKILDAKTKLKTDTSVSDKERIEKMRLLDDMDSTSDDLMKSRDLLKTTIADVQVKAKAFEEVDKKKFKEISQIRDPIRREQEYALYAGKIRERNAELNEGAMADIRKFKKNVEKMNSLVSNKQDTPQISRKERRRRELAAEKASEALEDVLDRGGDFTMADLVKSMQNANKPKKKKRRKLSEMSKEELDTVQEALESLDLAEMIRRAKARQGIDGILSSDADEE